MNKEEMINALNDVKNSLFNESNEMIGIRNAHPRPEKDSIELKQKILYLTSVFIFLISFVENNTKLSIIECLIAIFMKLNVLYLNHDYNEMMKLCDDMDEIVEEIVPVMRENIKKTKIAIDFVENLTEEELQRYLSYKIN